MLSAKKAARISLTVVVGLMVLKIAVGIITGSISVLAQAADSLLDLFAVIITFFSVIIAARPADKEHPFGHGKVENIAAVIQALLILTAGVTIIYSSVQRIITREPLEMTYLGIAVMAVSVVASIFLSRYLRSVARQTDSISLEANSRNIATDVYSAVAVLAGLTVVQYTGIYLIDPIIAIGVALFILKVGVDVARRSSTALIDVKLPEDEEQAIASTIMNHCTQVVSFHDLRTRKSGHQRYIDLHMVVPKDLSVAEAHDITDHLEDDIRRALPHTSVVIHIEPCDGNCEECSLNCDLKKKSES